MKKGMKPGDDSSTGAVEHGVQDASAHANGSDNCYQLALRYIEHRQRSEAEVYRYLYSKNAFSDEAIETAISKLKNLKLIDDREFAQSWRNDRLTFKPRSRSLIKRELVQKGVDPIAINEAISDIDDLESAFQVAKKRAALLSKLGYQEFYRRLAGYLGRRGYSGEVITTTIRKVWHLLQEST